MASDDEAAPAAFDEEDATRLAKKMKVDELRAALEAAGADTEGTKPALIERLVAAQRAAASPQPMEEDSDADSAWEVVDEAELLEATAAVVRAASALGGDAFFLAVDGDENAQEELCELCDCDPELFDMLGAMVSGYTVSY